MIITAALLLGMVLTLIEMTAIKINPGICIHKLPPDIQKSVHTIPRYQGKTGTFLGRIAKKAAVLALLLTIFIGVVYTAGARKFGQGCFGGFLLFMLVKLFVTLVLYCGWYAHTPSVWILGTQDLKSSYRNYRFYLWSIGKSLPIGLFVGSVIGFLIQLSVQ